MPFMHIPSKMAIGPMIIPLCFVRNIESSLGLVKILPDKGSFRVPDHILHEKTDYI